jgi:hypothetical protein
VALQTREYQPLIGISNAVRRINIMADQVADTSASVLILSSPGKRREEPAIEISRAILCRRVRLDSLAWQFELTIHRAVMPVLDVTGKFFEDTGATRLPLFMTGCSLVGIPLQDQPSC